MKCWRLGTFAIFCFLGRMSPAIPGQIYSPGQDLRAPWAECISHMTLRQFTAIFNLWIFCRQSERHAISFQGSVSGSDMFRLRIVSECDWIWFLQLIYCESNALSLSVFVHTCISLSSKQKCTALVVSSAICPAHNVKIVLFSAPRWTSGSLDQQQCLHSWTGATGPYFIDKAIISCR